MLKNVTSFMGQRCNLLFPAVYLLLCKQEFPFMFSIQLPAQSPLEDACHFQKDLNKHHQWRDISHLAVHLSDQEITSNYFHDHSPTICGRRLTSPCVLERHKLWRTHWFHQGEHSSASSEVTLILPLICYTKFIRPVEENGNHTPLQRTAWCY